LANTLLPCTVFDWEWNRDDVVSEELSTQEIEWFALEWLGMAVGNHFVGRTVVNFDVSFFNLVGQMKMMNVKGTGVFGRAAHAICQQKDGAFVVLVKNVVLNFVALGFQKTFGPENKLRHVVCANKFGFGAAASVELLFAGSVEDATALESHGSSSVTFEVGMNCESCVDKPTDNVEAVSREDEFIVPGFGKEDHETWEFVPIILVGVLDLSAQGGNHELDVRASPFAKEESLCNKGVKDFGFFRGQLGGSACGVEVRRSWSRSGILGSELDWEVIKHGLNAVFHVNADLAAVAKIKVHCGAVMEVTASLFCFAAMTTHGVEPVSKFIGHQTGNVACHDVVHMEANGVLLAVNHLIGDAGIIGVELASDRFQVGTELFAPEEGGLKHAAECLLEEEIQV